MSEDELVQEVLHVDSVSASIGDEDGFKLYLQKPDGSGVVIPIGEEAYQSIEQDFILTEEPDKFS